MPPAPRNAWQIWGSAGLFMVAVVIAAGALIGTERSEAIDQGEQRLRRVVASAEANANRALVAMDMTLASTDDTLADLRNPEGQIDRVALRQRLTQMLRQGLLLGDLAVVDEQSRVVAAAQDTSVRLGLPLPEGFARKVVMQPVPALLVSAPSFSPTSAERVVFLARPVSLGAQQRGLVVAQMSVADLGLILGQAVDERELEITLEREDGLLLTSRPAAERQTGTFVTPELPAGWAAALSQRALARLSGQPALVAARPLLYRQLRVVGSLPINVALSQWQHNRWIIGAGAAGFCALVLAFAALAQRQANRFSRARAELAESKTTLEQALASMHDGLLLCDAQDRVIIWNQRYVELFPWLQPVLQPGVPFARLAEAAAGALFPEGSATERQAWVAERLSQRDKDRTMHTRTASADRMVHTIERRTPDGGMVSVYRDTTTLGRELARLKDAAESANDSRSHFLAAMGHELRTPLDAMLGMNSLLLASPLNPQQRRQAELVNNSGQSLLALINDLLDLSRIEAGHLALEQVDFALRETVADVIGALDARAQAKHLVLRLITSPDLPAQVRGDPTRLRQVLFNLVGNALTFTDTGKVDVTLSHRVLEDGHVELSVEVEDTGVGIAPEALPQLFEPFALTDNRVSRRYGLTGLGLAITRQITERMGGDVRARSVPGQGSVFTAHMVFAAATGSHAAPAAGQGRRILVAEDNTVNQILIKAMLDRLGHQCEVVADGQAAVHQVQAAHYDLVLMDLQMPVMDGISAALAIRALPAPKNRVPIVSMTANDQPEDREACERAGMSQHVGKPIDLPLLEEAIDRACRDTAGA